MAEGSLRILRRVPEGWQGQGLPPRGRGHASSLAMAAVYFPLRQAMPPEQPTEDSGRTREGSYRVRA